MNPSHLLLNQLCGHQNLMIPDVFHARFLEFSCLLNLMKFQMYDNLCYRIIIVSLFSSDNSYEIQIDLPVIFTKLIQTYFGNFQISNEFREDSIPEDRKCKTSPLSLSFNFDHELPLFMNWRINWF